MKAFENDEAERIVQAYSDLILRLSYTYLKSTQDAEDICQTVLLKFMTSGKVFESAEHERAWIIRVTANTCKDHLRRLQYRHTVCLEAVAELPAPPAPESDVLDAVMALPVKYREAIYLYYFEGYTTKEIGKMLGRSIAAVNAHLSRGRKKLRTLLGGEYCEKTI
ncbi:RNA polymerase sigma factor [Eubacterium sp. 1001713B170207_170306_E7]|uniref:RNA polymerase sigma factor n=1 Tax=Eubacterium sp. 1001713B170207_170306_E7 TaxID=2787097 RepID=UPI0018995923|nr:RNA polymerase sigma factor [Eubacterium sp. 1001713B170207_170306_E7]